MEIKALKKFGQNFLKNKIKLEEIARAADISAGDVIIEIGPGHGELTEFLVDKFLVFSDYDLILIEKDERLIRDLRDKISESKWKNVEIVAGDALKILPELTKNSKLKTRNYKIVGNIPYYITGHLFRIISELENKPKLSVFTLQKEVAERICGTPKAQPSPYGSGYPKAPIRKGEMNLLAASIGVWAKPEIISYIPKTDFEPVPKVDSAVIRLTTNDLQLTTEELGRYYNFIHLLFKQPRKMIVNNLTSVIGNQQLVIGTKDEITEKLKKMGINPKSRPQDLSVEQIVELASQYLVSRI